jgi:hypothetical protein
MIVLNLLVSKSIWNSFAAFCDIIRVRHACPDILMHKEAKYASGNKQSIKSKQKIS